MSKPVKASQVAPKPSPKTKRELAGEAARRAVTDKKARTKPKGECATAAQLRAGMATKAKIGGARGAVRRTQITEAVRARLADRKSS